MATSDDKRRNDDGRYPAIESHAVIGDLQTVALVALDGTIDFLCLPAFDSPTVFASLLDADRGGSFAIRPVLDDVRHTQLYLPDTNVLLTRFLSAAGVAEIADFMPVRPTQQASSVIRSVKTVRGEVGFRMRCAPRFDYARAKHMVEQTADGAIFVGPGGLTLRLTSTVPLTFDSGDAIAEFTLRSGEVATFVLDHVPDDGPRLLTGSDSAWTSLTETLNYWRNWIGGSTYQGRWRDQVNRSALVLKLLQSRRHGSIIAAPTFGLPERIGGGRNWDYRYTWIRDASFILNAFIRLGLASESRSFIDWLIGYAGTTSNAAATLQPLYGVDGRREVPEEVLSHLEGYRGSSPVRVGNAAAQQLQLDIYGELLDALYLYDEHCEPTSHDLWLAIARLVNWVAEHWNRPDAGVWESRDRPRHYLYSRLMCWVAIDRGIRLAIRRSFPAPIARWHATRDRIYRDVFRNFWDPKARTFVGVRGTTRVDGSCLTMPLVGFISPTDPRWLSTLTAVEQRLIDDSLVYRYESDDPRADAAPREEGTFSMCSFLYIECLSRAGDLERARFIFEKMLGYANHVGLYAEEIGPSGEHLGNFPQAFTHLALINAAYDLDRRLSGAGWTA